MKRGTDGEFGNDRPTLGGSRSGIRITKGTRTTATATIASVTSHPVAKDATNTRCNFMKAALVRISGSGPINQTAIASFSVFVTV